MTLSNLISENKNQPQDYIQHDTIFIKLKTKFLRYKVLKGYITGTVLGGENEGMVHTDDAYAVCEEGQGDLGRESCMV